MLSSERIERYLLRYNAWVVVAAAVAYNLAIEHLTDRGYSAAALLVYRGALGCVLLAAAARWQRVSAWPHASLTQLLRFLNSGLALLCAFEAFRRLAGVTVSVVQRLDIPFAVLMGVAAGQRPRDGKFWLSLLAIAMVGSLFFFAGNIDEDPVGLALALVAVGQTAFAYLLGKKSVASENNLAIFNVTNLSCIGVGVVVCAVRGQISPLHATDLGLLGVSSLAQFVLIYTMAALFRHQDVTQAQRPYLLSSVLILGLEMLTEHKRFAFLHIGFVLALVTVLYFVTLADPAETLTRARGWLRRGRTVGGGQAEAVRMGRTAEET